VRSSDSIQADAELRELKANLNQARTLEILVCSPSEATIRFLKTVLNEFHVQTTTVEAELRDKIQGYATATAPLDFIISDDQTEGGAETLSQELDRVTFKDTKVIQLYTPTISLTGQPVFSVNQLPGIFKLTKPPRKSRVLQVLAELRNLPIKLSNSHISDLAKALEDVSSAQRILYGNVLIAEGSCLLNLKPT
jgi:hypothetical protein